MPALTMRGRYLMREYWSDSDLFLRLTAEQREIYIGLWMLADDEGWLPRDIPAISAAIYHYIDRQPRENRVRDALDRLRELGKVTSHRCCLHLPAVERYPRAGKKSGEHALEHRVHSKRNKPIQTDLNPLHQTGSNGFEPLSRRNPSLPDGSRDDAGPREGETELDFRARVGLPTFMGGKH